MKTRASSSKKGRQGQKTYTKKINVARHKQRRAGKFGWSFFSAPTGPRRSGSHKERGWL